MRFSGIGIRSCNYPPFSSIVGKTVNLVWFLPTVSCLAFPERTPTHRRESETTVPLSEPPTLYPVSYSRR